MEKIKVNLVLEILGRPAEHIVAALGELVEKLGKEEGVKIIKKTIHEAVKAEGSKDLFTSFAEIELEIASLHNYFGIIFSYMPAHVEILNPEKLNLTNFELNEIGNRLVQRLHDYDAITKKAINDNSLLLNKLKEVAPQLFKEKKSDPKVNISINPDKEKKKKQ